MKKLQTARALLLSILLTLPHSPALAGGLSAVFNGKSIHVDADEEWNEENYGLGFEYELERQSAWKKHLMVNGFRDSNDEMSYMFGGGLHRSLFATERMNGFYVDAGVNAFLMTRRDVNDNRPFPGVLPSLTVGNRHMGLNLTYLPKAAVDMILDEDMTDDSIKGVFFLQFKVAISQLLPRDYLALLANRQLPHAPACERGRAACRRGSSS